MIIHLHRHMDSPLTTVGYVSRWRIGTCGNIYSLAPLRASQFLIAPGRGGDHASIFFGSNWSDRQVLSVGVAQQAIGAA